MTAEINLSENEQHALENLARRTGRTPDELVYEAVRRLIGDANQETRLELMRQARGMWKERDDLPSAETLRRELDRS